MNPVKFFGELGHHNAIHPLCGSVRPIATFNHPRWPAIHTLSDRLAAIFSPYFFSSTVCSQALCFWRLLCYSADCDCAPLIHTPVHRGRILKTNH
jgi:hypothetical protein